MLYVFCSVETEETESQDDVFTKLSEKLSETKKVIKMRSKYLAKYHSAKCVRQVKI